MNALTNNIERGTNRRDQKGSYQRISKHLVVRSKRQDNRQIEESLLSEDAVDEIRLGNIPDLSSLCAALYEVLRANRMEGSVLAALPLISKFTRPSQESLDRFKLNPKTRHVLVDNDVMKVVLIHWQKSDLSSIHGHPVGGCLFKVLEGSVSELRCSNDDSRKLYSNSTYHAGSIAYIDDLMGLHAVGNPFNTSAVSLHVYTKGK